MMQSYTQNAAVNMLRWYATNMPAELPGLVRRLERRPMALGQDETTDTRNWFQRGLSAIGDLGATAITAVGSYRLEREQSARAQEIADQEWQLQLAEQRRLADELQLKAATTLATVETRRRAAAAAQEATLLAREQQAAKTRGWIMPAVVGIGVLGLLWFWTTTRNV